MIYSFAQEKVVRSSSGNSEFPISVLLINFGEKRGVRDKFLSWAKSGSNLQLH